MVHFHAAIFGSFSHRQRHLEDRYQRRSTLVASQLPVANWHEYLGDPTLADAILDRLVHNAHAITLKGESMRKHNKPLSANGKTGTTETK